MWRFTFFFAMPSAPSKDDLAIGARIREVVDAFATRAAAAEVARVSTQQLHNWMTAKNTPSLMPIARMALDRGYRIEWVATGKGPKRDARQQVLRDAVRGSALAMAMHNRFAELKNRMLAGLQKLYASQLMTIEPSALDAAAATLTELVTENIDLEHEVDDGEVTEAVELALKAHREAHGLARAR